LEFSAEKSFEKLLPQEIPRKITRKITFRGKNAQKIGPRDGRDRRGLLGFDERQPRLPGVQVAQVETQLLQLVRRQVVVVEQQVVAGGTRRALGSML
jgi:hypothetical protein